jgi:hypothetical protein
MPDDVTAFLILNESHWKDKRIENKTNPPKNGFPMVNGKDQKSKTWLKK